MHAYLSNGSVMKATPAISRQYFRVALFETNEENLENRDLFRRHLFIDAILAPATKELKRSLERI